MSMELNLNIGNAFDLIVFRLQSNHCPTSGHKTGETRLFTDDSAPSCHRRNRRQNRQQHLETLGIQLVRQANKIRQNGLSLKHTTRPMLAFQRKTLFA